jgi:hypothetical protein
MLQRRGEYQHLHLVPSWRTMYAMLQMIRNSRPLQIILAVDMVALLLYNVAGMMVTGQLGAVFRTVLETTRTLFVWLVSGTNLMTPAQAPPLTVLTCLQT